jgi:PRTRC genetic system protein E
MTTFASLMPLLTQSQAVTVILSANGDQVTATVMPKPKADRDNVLSQPLQLTGTAAELDEGFATAVTSWSGKRLSLVEQVEAANAILDANKSSIANKAAGGKKTPATKSPIPASSQSTSTDDDDEGDDSGSGTEPSASDTGNAVNNSGNAALADLFQ